MVEFDESLITKAIVSEASKKLLDLTEIDAAVVGAGPSGLTAAYYLAKKGLKVAIFERRLTFGGGIGGGGMQLPAGVVEEPADEILREVKVRLKGVGNGLYVFEPADMIAKLASSAIDAGADVILGVSVEDVMYREDEKGVRITGIVAQWSSVTLSGIHVDPLSFKAKAVVDCTGHDAEILRIVEKKVPNSGVKVYNEASMWAERGEELVVKNSGKVIPGLYAAGLAVSQIKRTARMGPIFGGMILSGKKVAEEIARELVG